MAQDPQESTTEKKKIKQSTAKKRNLQNKKRRLMNRSQRSRIRSEVKQFREACATAQSSIPQEDLSGLYQLIDRAAKKGLFKQNKASRMKSRLSIAARSVCTQTG